MESWKTARLGRTKLRVGRLGLAASYGADERCVREAFERGVNYLYWGSRRSESFAAGLRGLRSRRDEFVLVIQSYTRLAALLPWSLKRALRSLALDYADVLLLGMWNKDVPLVIFEQALQLREQGLIRHVAVSTHNRRHAATLAAKEANVDTLHVRYNAVHSGAERDIFPYLSVPEVRPGIVSFTATCWGELLNPDQVPSGNAIPLASDCYRFVLTNPAVDVCLMGPRSVSDLTAALDGWDKGPMTPEEMAWMRRVGQAKYRRLSRFSLRWSENESGN
jgi:aryl-alcohol dehydrogenase-like predicted oxidoreductase